MALDRKNWTLTGGNEPWLRAGLHDLDAAVVARKYAFMRTTIDLPDPLFKEAKSAAALRGVTLRDVIEEALRRQLQPQARPALAAATGAGLEVKNGMLVIKRKGKSVINPTAAQLDDWL